ncbi:ubiquitin-protein transferase activity protein [Halocaridina rubra]|uniref:Ubiquitin-protein transferase activity protein n=1 Tax=Halocaridina rubra TaxID=373956 RepID=A0AAN8X994_HALRR
MQKLLAPVNCHSNERLFLRDFVSCAGGTSGGRLARWLQPDSYVDIRACEVLYSRDDMRAGWPAIVTICTRDQYNEVVHVPSLKVEVVAVPVSTGEDGHGKLRRVSQHVADNMTFGGHPQPSLDVPYQVSIKDKMCYCAITMIKAYENYSFEELRYTSPAMRRPTENMLVRSNNDGTYSCNWTPGATGWYSLHVTIDSYQLDEVI